MPNTLPVLWGGILPICLLCTGCPKQESAGTPTPAAMTQPERQIGLVEREVAEVPWDKREPAKAVMGMAPWRVVREGEKARMVMPGYTGRLYDDVSENSVRATPDLKHIAYLAKNDGRSFVVVDHRDEPAFDRIAYDTIRLSDDGSRVAYALNTHSGGFTEWVADGQKLPESHFLRDLAFSPDGRHLAYHVTTDKGQTRLYMDGKVKASYDMASLRHLAFSPDSRRLLWVYEDKQASVMIDGQRGPAFERIKWNYPGWEQVFFFSADGKRVAYVGQRDGKDFLVVDQIAGEPLQDANVIGIKFSPDGNHVACMAGLPDAKWFLIVDGQRTTPRGHVIFESITFDPDSKQLAYRTSTDSGWKIFMIDIPGNHHAVPD